ncbi:hypothetical protein ACHAXT_010931 [Thalassiosira profunda]
MSSANNGSDGCCKVIKSADENGAFGSYQQLTSRPDSSPGPPSPDGPLNYSSNVLNEMRHMENVNFVLALACLVYCGINVALIVVNYVNSNHSVDPPVPEKAFHLLEFWATFIFAVVECVSLTSTPKSLMNVYNNPLVLRLVLFFNIVASSLPAVLISLNYEYFEIISHEIEYLNELTMSFVDLVLLWSLVGIEKSTNVMMAGIASMVAIVQLLVYNGMGKDSDGDMAGEVPAHYLEFTVGIISSLIAFCFCLDNKFVCAKEIGEILFGTHHHCTTCNANSSEFVQIRKNSLSRYGSLNTRGWE